MVFDKINSFLINEIFYTGLRKILSCIFPPCCVICGVFLNSMGFCSNCWKDLQWLWGVQEYFYCHLCGHPLNSKIFQGFLEPQDLESKISLGSQLCFFCLKDTPFFVYHRSLWAYGPSSRRAVFSLKHGKQKSLGAFFAHLLIPLVPKSMDYIVVMPLHKKRLLKRGFNQMSPVARCLSQYTGIPFLENILIRQYNTRPQGGLSPSERKENVFHSFTSKEFSLENTLKPKCKILLLDDVFTTGASLNACSKVLLENNVDQVFCLTLAKVL